ncbi:MAG: PHP domain-containing protein, partial [Oscillospiraceae bacterium]|nr:PHP domain-containing protein [Oscillospiraceae bacterium]
MDTSSMKRFGDIFRINDTRLDVFSETYIKTMTADKAENKIMATLYSERLLLPCEISAAEVVIAERYKLSGARLIPTYPSEFLNEANIDEYFKILDMRLRDEFPSATGYLSGAEWSFDLQEKILHLKLKSSTNGFFTTCVNFIKRAFETEFSMHIDIEVETDSEGDAAAEARVEMLRRRIEEEAVLSAQKPKTEKGTPAPVAEPQKEKFRPRKSLNEEKGEVILGKPFFSDYVEIKTIEEISGDISVKGEIFATESKVFESRQTAIFSFDMTDYTGSVRVVVRNIKLENLPEVEGKLKKGAFVHVYGMSQYDTYLKDNIIRPKNIMLGKAKRREDTASEKRVELHLHTNMSSMDGITPADKLIARAAEWGHKAIAITDHGVVQAYPDAMKAGPKNNIKILYGVEAYYGGSRDASIVTGAVSDSFDGEYVCFDIETTGLYKKTCKIIEIAGAILRNGEICERFQTYVNPNCAIPDKITELTGITNGMVAGAPEIDKALADFLAFAGNRPFAAHNADFDIGFISQACQDLGIEYDFNYIDTLEFSRRILPDIKNHKLDTVAKELRLPKFEHHRALDDAVTVAFILRSLFGIVKEKLGFSTCDKLNEISSASNGKEKLNRFHMIILVKNQVGLKNLYKLISFSHLKYYNKRPIIPKHELEKHREGLIIGSACEAGELYSAVVEGKRRSDLLRIAEFYDFLEIQPVGNNAFMIANGIASSEENIRDFNRTIISLGEELNIPVVATGDVHFLEPHDELYRRVIMASKNFSDADNQ